MVKYGTARQATYDNIKQRMRFAWCINKATETYSEYVILIDFHGKKWLNEGAAVLRNKQTACLV